MCPTNVSADDNDYSPPLPPRPLSMTGTQRDSIYTTISPLEDKGPFTLCEFVSKCGHILPLRVSVEKGYHGDDEMQSIAMGDTYNIHFVKHSKVVVLRDSTGVTYNIPLNSPVQFAPVFNDTNHPDKEEDQIYDRVSDVTALKTPPRLLRATKQYTREEKPLVEKNEILYVEKVISAPLRKKTLLVYSVSQNIEKVLPNDCEGGFTSDQYATRLHLPDIVSLFKDKFPLNVCVYITDIEFTSDSDFPFHLVSEVSVLTKIQTETSLVASTHWGDSHTTAVGDQSLIEIPIDLQIELSILEPGQREEDKELDLFKQTKTFFEDFDQAKVHTIRTSSFDLRAWKGHESEGVKLEEPNRVYEVIGARLQRPKPSPRRRPVVAPRHDRPASSSSTTPPVARRKLQPPSPSSKPRPLAQRLQNSAISHDQEVVQSAGDSSGVAAEEHVYQPLATSHKDKEEDSLYVTMAPAPRKPRGSGIVGDPKTDENAPVIKQLIARVETLEKQVASLNEKIETLMK